MPYYVGSIFEVVDTDQDGTTHREPYILTQEGKLVCLLDGVPLNDDTAHVKVTLNKAGQMVVEDKNHVINQGNEFFKVKYRARSIKELRLEELGND